MSEEINRKVNELLANMRAPFGPKEASWERLSSRIGIEVGAKDRSLRPVWIGVAASIVFAIGLFTLFSNQDVNITAEAAEHVEHILPDGSIIILNANSLLSYDAGSFESDRTLNLDGEAFFEVKKGSSFKVQTDQGVITVLGTSFNVCDRADFFEVTCKTGKVAVNTDTENIILTPGLATNNASGSLSEAFSEENTDGWRYGEYSFVEDDLEFVLEEVERQFAMDMKLPDLSGRLFTGEFDSKDLETTLTVICEPMGLNYSIDEETIVITIK